MLGYLKTHIYEPVYLEVCCLQYFIAKLFRHMYQSSKAYYWQGNLGMLISLAISQHSNDTNRIKALVFTLIWGKFVGKWVFTANKLHWVTRSTWYDSYSIYHWRCTCKCIGLFCFCGTICSHFTLKKMQHNNI